MTEPKFLSGRSVARADAPCAWMIRERRIPFYAVHFVCLACFVVTSNCGVQLGSVPFVPVETFAKQNPPCGAVVRSTNFTHLKPAIMRRTVPLTADRASP
jgi:hypothetical protein